MGSEVFTLFHENRGTRAGEMKGMLSELTEGGEG